MAGALFLSGNYQSTIMYISPVILYTPIHQQQTLRSTKMERKIGYNSSSRKWEVLTEEDETVGSWNVVTQYWSKQLNIWVTVPAD